MIGWKSNVLSTIKKNGKRKENQIVELIIDQIIFFSSRLHKRRWKKDKPKLWCGQINKDTRGIDDSNCTLICFNDDKWTFRDEIIYEICTSESHY